MGWNFLQLLIKHLKQIKENHVVKNGFFLNEPPFLFNKLVTNLEDRKIWIQIREYLRYTAPRLHSIKFKHWMPYIHEYGNIPFTTVCQ